MSPDVLTDVSPNDGECPVPLADLTLYFTNPEAWLHEQRRLFAHYLWEREGRPEGRSDEHWRAAERGIRMMFAARTTVNWDGLMGMINQVAHSLQTIRNKIGGDVEVPTVLHVLSLIREQFQNMVAATDSAIESVRATRFRIV